jgi:hypothetical protein
VELEQEEMMYLDGGYYIDKYRVRYIGGKIGTGIIGAIPSAASSSYFMTMIIRGITAFGGPASWIGAAFLLYAGKQLWIVAKAFASAFIQGNGLDVYFIWSSRNIVGANVY